MKKILFLAFALLSANTLYAAQGNFRAEGGVGELSDFAADEGVLQSGGVLDLSATTSFVVRVSGGGLVNSITGLEIGEMRKLIFNGNIELDPSGSLQVQGYAQDDSDGRFEMDALNLDGTYSDASCFVERTNSTVLLSNCVDTRGESARSRVSALAEDLSAPSTDIGTPAASDIVPVFDVSNGAALGYASFSTFDGLSNFVTSVTGTGTNAVIDTVYVVDSSSGAVEINAPGSPSQGNQFAVVDGEGSANTNNITVDFAVNLHGAAQDYVIVTDNSYVTFTYIDVSTGWVAND